MIKETSINVRISNTNRYKYISLGYDLSDINDGDEINVPIEYVSKSSKLRITAICKYCESETSITINKYYFNFNRNNKGFYSCFKCKWLEMKKTCIEKYGVDSYSKTSEFKETESKKWKGIRKNDKKYKETMIEKYGVDCYFKLDIMKENNRKWMSSDEFKNKSKETMIEKYGVDSYAKTDEFKQRIQDNKEIIVSKIKETFIEKYGVDWISKTNEWKLFYSLNREDIKNKIKETCIERYGVDNVSKVPDIQDKIRKSMELNGMYIPISLLNEWEIYKNKVRKLTNRVKNKLYFEWDGYDYYDGEIIKEYITYKHTHRHYPTIDHKISTYYGFMNNMLPEEISDISNLCITKRHINSSKNRLIESEFEKIINPKD